MNILLVDDDRDLADFLCDQLRSAGHHVEYADNKETATSLTGAGKFDLLILDRSLPDNVDGLDLLVDLRTRGTDTPALFLSGRSGLSEWIRSLEAGASDYLVKPISFENLFSRIQAIGNETLED